MVEIPEHLLQRSRERRIALGLPVDDEPGAAETPAVEEPVEAPAAPAETPAVAAPEPAAPEPVAEAPTAQDTPPEATPVEPAATETPSAPPVAEATVPAPTVEAPAAEAVDTGGVPAHLLERSRARRAALTGQAPPPAGAPAAQPGAAAPAAAVVAAAPAAAPTAQPGAAVLAPPDATSVGPGGHTQRLLTVVKSGSIQQTKADAVDKVHVWPHLLVSEFTALLALTALVTIFSALVRAPLLELADFNQTPNPSKAPWYFLGLQELLTMFHPMVAGVTIPGVAQVLLMFAPYIDRNPKINPADRKFAISVFTMFLMFWAVLVIIGSFFRGPGFNFVFPWNDGIFFDL